MYGIFLKTLLTIRNFLSSLSVRLQVAHCGSNLGVNGVVYVSGGKNITMGNGCRIGRNVVLDARSGPLVIGNDVDIRDNARVYAKDIEIGDGSTVAESSFLVGSVKTGKKVWIARNCDISGAILEEGVILGPSVSIVPGDHGRSAEGAVTMSGASAYHPVHIGSGAWLGTRSVILKGVTIGKNSIVGAGAVVTKPVPNGVVVAGVPAKPVKSSLDISKDLP